MVRLGSGETDCSLSSQAAAEDFRTRGASHTPQDIRIIVPEGVTSRRERHTNNGGRVWKQLPVVTALFTVFVSGEGGKEGPVRQEESLLA